MNRSENMRRIRSKNTGPELRVRQMLRSLGFLGYRINRNELPGRPDVVFFGRRKIILVHGCFWHGHTCKVGLREPKVNRDYWIPKISRTRERDSKNLDTLKQEGWDVLIIWECEISDRQSETLLKKAVKDFLSDS